MLRSRSRTRLRSGASSGGSALFFEAAAIGFSEEADTIACRFPAPLPLTETTGLLFFCQKNTNFSFGTENAQRTVVKDYEIDFSTETITFSATRVIEEPALWSTGLGYTSEPGPILVTQGPNAGRIILLTRTNDNADQKLTGGDPVIYNFYVRYSDDNGQTWSDKELAVDRAGNNYASASNLLELPSGRLIFPIYKGGGGIGVLYSDDHGTTWTRSALAVDTSRVWTEPCVFRKEDGTLVILARSDTSDANLERGQFSSTDEGETWAFDEINTAAAFKNSCTAATQNEGALILGSTANPGYYQRVKYRVRLSADEAATFPVEFAPFADKDGIGYSHLANLPSGKMVLGYETFSPDVPTNPDGEINDRNGINMAVLNVAAVRNGVASPVAAVPAETASELYTAYETRVIADGGQVTDPVACEAAIQAAIDGGYWGWTGHAIAPNWGVKLSGSNITKLYSLNGTNDFTVAGTMSIDTTTSDWATANCTTTATNASCAAAQIAQDVSFALCSSTQAVSTTNPFQCGVGGSASTADIPASVQTRNTGTAGLPGFVRDTNNTVFSGYNRTVTRHFAAQCLFVETEMRRNFFFEDGTNHYVGHGALPFLGEGLTRRLVVNGNVIAAGTVSSGVTGLWNEFWHLNKSTYATARQLSIDQGARYT